MGYTLWSRGRLVGETDLGFVFRPGRFRCGWLHPTASGERLMPAATGVAPALRTAWMIGPDATARADVLSAVDQEEALELELRGPDGGVIATEDIAIVDTHYLLSIAESDMDSDDDADDAEQDADIEALLERWNEGGDLAGLQLQSEEETELPRYQIQVRLVDHRSVP
jgi:hypothetical protein